jgi:hypothetical protein
VDDLIATCPTAAEINYLSRVRIIIDADPTAPDLVCRASEGSADLTRLQERAYQALRVIWLAPLDVIPVPWSINTAVGNQSGRSLYDWLTATLGGVRFRSDISSSFCCDPARVINIPVNNLAALQTTRWVDPALGIGLDGLVMLIIHETRHIDFGPHTCGTNDQSISEFGAWGVQYYAEEWFAFHTGTFLMPTLPAPSSSYYQTTEWNAAQRLRDTRFCGTSPLFASPAALDFAGQALNSQSVPWPVSITAGSSTPITISGVDISGDTTSFAVTSSCTNVALPPSCLARVSFTPSTEGPKSATLVVQHSASSTPLTVALRGTGGPLITMFPDSAVISPGLSWRFGGIVTGTDEGTFTWTVLEGDAGGTISPDPFPYQGAVYTAPLTSGTYHVVVTNSAVPNSSATATVIVR